MASREIPTAENTTAKDEARLNRQRKNRACFRVLQKYCSEKALKLLLSEYEKGSCGCTLPITHNLPCAHLIQATFPAQIGVGPPPTDIPLFMRAFIERYVTVPADGQCGFSSIAVSLGLGEGAWAKVRSDLKNEAKKNQRLYEDVVVYDRKVQNVIERIDWFESEPREKHWFSLPDMGHMVATCYQCVFSVLGDSTYLPLVSSPETNVNNIPIICIAYLESTCHFVSVKLSPGAPLPPLSLLWPRNHDDSVDGLDQKLSQWFEYYKVGLRGSI